MSHEDQLVTKEEVLLIANQTWPGSRFIDYKISSFSDERLGFLSLHRSLYIEIESSNKTRESQTFFVKGIPPEGDQLAICMKDMGVFNREIAFYRDVVPELRINFEEEPWCPSSFGITKRAIILEDLRNRNFSLAPSKTFNFDEMNALLFALARMHAATISAEHRLGKKLNEVYPEAFELDSVLKPDGFFSKWFNTGVNLGIQLAEELGLKTDKMKPACEKWFELIKPQNGRQNVITHTDLWSNNILFDKKSPPTCILIDFQWTRYCPPAQEVNLVLHYCNDQKFRDKHQDELLKSYYNEVTRILKKQGLNFESWEEFMKSMEEQTLVAKMNMVLCYPSIFMSGEEVAIMFDSEEKTKEFMFVDKAPVTKTLMKKGGEYEQRVKQAVIELATFCERMIL